MNDEERDEEIEIVDMEEEEQEDDDWQDEPEPLKPWMTALVFLGLVVLAAVLCALLWKFTHRNGGQIPDDSSIQGPVITNSEEPAQTSGEQETQTPIEEQTPAPTTEAEPTATPEPEQTPTATQSPVANVTASPEKTDPKEPSNGDVSMSFDQVQESVTPKDLVNLRSVPSTADENTIVLQASNGEVLTRTGINPDMGWSRIDYNGQTLYAVTQFLTTDLSYKPPVQPSDPNRVTTVSGRVIIFTNCDDYLTPKEYVNLRTEPSTTEGDATVRCQVSNGETVHRTGYSPDYGWSRVEYNGEVLYVVTSLMQAP